MQMNKTKQKGMEKFIIAGMFVGIAIVLAMLSKNQMQVLLTDMFAALSSKATTNLF